MAVGDRTSGIVPVGETGEVYTLQTTSYHYKGKYLAHPGRFSSTYFLRSQA